MKQEGKISTYIPSLLLILLRLSSLLLCLRNSEDKARDEKKTNGAAEIAP
jgi:hypothetical protein